MVDKRYYYNTRDWLLQRSLWVNNLVGGQDVRGKTELHIDIWRVEISAVEISWLTVNHQNDIKLTPYNNNLLYSSNSHLVLLYSAKCCEWWIFHNNNFVKSPSKPRAHHARNAVWAWYTSLVLSNMYCHTIVHPSAYFYTACAVCVTSFSTSGKFLLVLNFTWLHTLAQVACFYALLLQNGKASVKTLVTQCHHLWWDMNSLTEENPVAMVMATEDGNISTSYFCNE